MSEGGDHTNSRKLNMIICLMILCLTDFSVSVFAEQHRHDLERLVML